MTALQGTKADQLLALEGRFNALRRDLDLLQARSARVAPSSEVRLARIEGSPAGGDNTYSVTFLDGTFAETAGNQTPSYQDRGPGFVHNVITSPSSPPTGSEIIICWRWSGRWWFEWE